MRFVCVGQVQRMSPRGERERHRGRRALFGGRWNGEHRSARRPQRPSIPSIRIHREIMFHLIDNQHFPPLSFFFPLLRAKPGARPARSKPVIEIEVRQKAATEYLGRQSPVPTPTCIPTSAGHQSECTRCSRSSDTGSPAFTMDVLELPSDAKLARHERDVP